MAPQQQQKHKVCIIGSGNWGTTIAKVLAENTRANPDLFEEKVQMWVFEENITIPKNSKHYVPDAKPQKITHVINSLHENVKYLPGVPLPDNLIANPDLLNTVHNASILVFNLPHQFLNSTCDKLRGKILPFARGISCIKGVEVSEFGCELFSDSIGRKLGIYCGALSGANIASEVGREKFSETTVAYEEPAVDVGNRPLRTGSSVPLARLQALTNTVTAPKGPHLEPIPASYPALNHANVKRLFHRPYFHVRLVNDVAGVSLGGALKNVVALAAGFVDGLGWGDNAKAAMMRVGLAESVKFGKMFFSTVRAETFTEESCGVADLITSCSAGRNFRCSKMSVAERKPIAEIEARELNGQKLQGTSTAYEVNAFLVRQKKDKEFPLFTAVYNILEGNARPEDLPELIEPSAEN